MYSLSNFLRPAACRTRAIICRMDILRRMLGEANYDDALSLVRGVNPHALVHADPTDRLRQACMSSDVLDYGGFYDDASRWIEDAGKTAEQRLSTVADVTDIPDTAHTKQECWALMVWGMSVYRHADHGYLEAIKRFQLAERILRMLNQSGIHCIGSLARARYCIGLVHRQRKDYRLARAAFGSSIELGGIGVQMRKERNQPTLSFDYNMARCYGLGIGWIAYDEALLPQAKSALVIAGRLLMDKKVKFIRAYLDVIHAAATMSGSMKLETVDEGITKLQKAYDVLAPSEGVGHAPYALRAANEMAQAYIRRARTVPDCEKDRNLCTAEAFLKKVTASKTKHGEKRTQVAALIITSRILRERQQHSAALEVAYKARNVAGRLRFSQIDSCITVGEAAYELGEYDEAIEAFKEALHLGRGSRKIEAVCHLHLSRAYLGNTEPAQSADHFKQWEALEPDIDNAFLVDLGNRVRSQLTPVFGDFRVPSTIGDLNSKQHVEHLHYWLAVTALQRTKDDRRRAADLLDIGVAALGLWLKQGPKDSELPAST